MNIFEGSHLVGVMIGLAVVVGVIFYTAKRMS